MTELLLKQEVYNVVGAGMAVYNELGPGFLEAVYHEALEIELGMRGVPFKSHVPLVVTYKGQPLQRRYEADIVAYGQLVVELKALTRLSTREHAQVLHYLKATGMRVGLLLNFGHPSDLDWKRMVK
jgi:GxxExxY protein